MSTVTPPVRVWDETWRPKGVGRRARRDAVVRMLAGSALWLSLLLVTFWWEVDGGVRDLGGWATGLDSVGRISAQVASVLLLVVVTSIKAARRRLRYESWHLLHPYGYVGVGLALPHQLWSGQEFLSSPGRTFFWWTAWAVAAGAVLVWRIGLPVVRNLRHRLRVARSPRSRSCSIPTATAVTPRSTVTPCRS
jgi:DMSO/TMAO reductase YedYZ heme-binding membrane subunit